MGFANGDSVVDVVHGVSFTLSREKLGIVGESGSGKSTVGRTLLKLHPRSARVQAKKLSFDGIDLLRADERQMMGIRGRRMSMIMQDPKYSLNPVMRIGDQIAEAFLAHDAKADRAAARDRTLAMPTLIGANRSLAGTAGLMVCGSFGALLFARLAQRLAPAQS